MELELVEGYPECVGNDRRLQTAIVTVKRSQAKLTAGQIIGWLEKYQRFNNITGKSARIFAVPLEDWQAQKELTQ